MELVRLFSTLFPLALTSGINLYGTVLIVGLCIRYGWVADVPPAFHVLASEPVLIAAGIFYALEFFADKVQFVDQVWDVLHTIIRPLGAAVIAFSAVAEVDPELAFIVAMASGSVALASHSGKAGSRVALNMTSPAENITNITISVLEDVAVGILAVLALTYPYVATGIAGVILGLIFVFVPPMLRWSWFNLTALFARFKGMVRPIEASEPLPEAHALLLPRVPEVCGRCKADNVQGAKGRTGYLSLTASDVFFTYDGWFRSHVWRAGLREVRDVSLRHRVLLDVLEMEHQGVSGKPRVVRFGFTKDRAALAAEFGRRLTL